jgi:hypothetical protein
MGRGLDVFLFTQLACVQFSSLAGWRGGSRAGNGGRHAPAGPTVFGGNSEGDTPLPIPNRAVKPLSADGTWWETAWESRSPPVLTETIRAASASLGRLFSCPGGTPSHICPRSFRPPPIRCLRAGTDRCRRCRSRRGRGSRSRRSRRARESDPGRSRRRRVPADR